MLTTLDGCLGFQAHRVDLSVASDGPPTRRPRRGDVCTDGSMQDQAHHPPSAHWIDSTSDNDGALALFSKSQAIRDELCTKEPENLAHRREFGIACFWVGIAFAKLQRWQVFPRNHKALRKISHQTTELRRSPTASA
ncbi:MAG: hypothetical protein ACK5E3_01330 [Planctomycetota bacterium]